jgi:hypothetical protein
MWSRSSREWCTRAAAGAADWSFGIILPLPNPDSKDNIVNQKVAQRLLRCPDYCAGIAADGQRAVTAPQTHSQPIIVVMMAAALPEVQQASAKVGMDAFITKPLRMEQLTEVLRSVGRNTTQAGQQSEDK